MDEYQMPKKIGGILERFNHLIPLDRRVRMTIQAYISNILELQSVLEKESVRCSGRVIYISTDPYLKRELMNHAAQILTLLREKDHLYFDALR